MQTDTRPANSEARAPQITRDSTSRPISSVPNQYCALGALRTALQLVATGSYGAMYGAKTAITTKKITTTRPSIAPRRRTRRRQARWPGVAPRGMTTGGRTALIGRQPLSRGLTRKYARSASRLRTM